MVRNIAMHRDIKDIVGVLMRVLGGGEVSRDEVMELSFEADGELLAALNEAYIKLLEFAHDRESGGDNDEVFLRTRAVLQDCLDKILDVCDREPARATLANELWAIKASYETTIYTLGTGVEMTLLWASHKDYAAGKKFLTDMGAACGQSGDIRPGTPEFFSLKDRQQLDALYAFRKQLQDRKKR
ncbi:MAG: hypothetical protein HY244_12090 [Rhizobiales bacterium]|nr:hypothetical protein [Hyphomicrobiales bacterium]